MLVAELRIYKISSQLRDELHQELILISHYWANKDVDQVMRSSSSIPSNIAEGHSRRFYPKGYIHFLTMSLGSGDETQNHIIAMRNKGSLNSGKADHFFRRYKDLSIRILNYINYLRKKYCI